MTLHTMTAERLAEIRCGHPFADSMELLAELDAQMAAVQSEREECAKVCEVKINRESGYGGQWEGYGSHMGDMTGPECAAAIRARGEASNG